MNMEEYIQKYGKQYMLSADADKKAPNEVDCHMFLFNEETACCWGGPFDGNYALGMLIDYTKPDQFGRFRHLPTAAEIENEKEAKRRKIIFNLPPGKEREKKLEALENYDRQEHPTEEKPYRIWMMGNDDTSYSKFFSSLAEAQEEFELLKACQPLDMVKDIYDNNFVFTN